MTESIIQQLKPIRHIIAYRKRELADYINSNLDKLPPELIEKAALYFDALNEESQLLSSFIEKKEKELASLNSSQDI